MDPYNEKIWKRPLEELTSGWVAGRVPDAPDRRRAARRDRHPHRGLHAPGDLLLPEAAAASRPSPTAIASTALRANPALDPVRHVRRHGARLARRRRVLRPRGHTIPLNELPGTSRACPRTAARPCAGSPSTRSPASARARPPAAPGPLLDLSAPPRPGADEPRHLHVELLARHRPDGQDLVPAAR
jgi:hypothetical protein